jgi:eukaryotic-like serine/threonine-protein kinase
LQYPSNWDKQENGTKQDTQTDVVSFSPSVSNSNASLDVSTDSGVKGESIAQYSSGSLNDLKQSFKNFKLIESTNTFLAGLPAYRLIYTSEDGNTLVTIKGDTAYFLTYEGGVNEYDKYLPTAQTMVDSFQITK